MRLGSRPCWPPPSCSTACSDDGGASGRPRAEPVASVDPDPDRRCRLPPPPTGKLLADMRQSSRDAAASRFEVWIDNDTARQITPDAGSTYSDRRFRTDAARRPGCATIPSQSERGFPLYQPGAAGLRPPARPAARSPSRTATRRRTVPRRRRDRRGRPLHPRPLPRARRRRGGRPELGRRGARGGEAEGATGTLTLVVTPTGVRRSDADHRHRLRHAGALAGRAPTSGARTSRSPATRRAPAHRPAAQADPLRRPRVRGVGRRDGVQDRRCTSTASPARSRCG